MGFAVSTVAQLLRRTQVENTTDEVLGLRSVEVLAVDVAKEDVDLEGIALESISVTVSRIVNTYDSGDIPVVCNGQAVFSTFFHGPLVIQFTALLSIQPLDFVYGALSRSLDNIVVVIEITPALHFLGFEKFLLDVVEWIQRVVFYLLGLLIVEKLVLVQCLPDCSQPVDIAMSISTIRYQPDDSLPMINPEDGIESGHTDIAHMASTPDLGVLLVTGGQGKFRSTNPVLETLEKLHLNNKEWPSLTWTLL